MILAEEFYRLRDERTNRLTENLGYQNFHVGIVADDRTTSTFVGQVMLLVSANLLARWCRRITLVFADSEIHPRLHHNGLNTLRERIAKETEQADPFGQFVFNNNDIPSNVDYILKIGGGLPNQEVSFTIDADEWIAVATQGAAEGVPSSKDGINPIGGIFASCIGVSDAFKAAVAFSKKDRVDGVSINLWDFSVNQSSNRTPAFPNNICIGNTQQIGAGAVGSSVVYILAMLEIEGTLQLIDHDTVEFSNLNRSPIFGFPSIGKAKVTECQSYLSNNFTVVPYPLKYDQFIDKYRRRPNELDLILPLANDYGFRNYLEANFPPIEIYGTTTRDWGINYHRHIPLIEDCSVCRFPIQNEKAGFNCSTSEIQTNKGIRIDAALPFLSMAAGAIVVADIIKLQEKTYPQTPNFAMIDFKRKMDFIPVFNRPKQKSCSCQNRSKRIHESYVSETRFSSLSL